MLAEGGMTTLRNPGLQQSARPTRHGSEPATMASQDDYDTISLLSISASEPATMVARIVSLLQRQSNTNTTALRHSALRFYYTPSRYTRAEARASEPDRPHGTKSVHGTHGRKAGLTTEAIGYIAMDLRGTGWYGKEWNCGGMWQESSEIQREIWRVRAGSCYESPGSQRQHVCNAMQAFDSIGLQHGHCYSILHHEGEGSEDTR